MGGLQGGLVPTPFSRHVRGRDTPLMRSLSLSLSLCMAALYRRLSPCMYLRGRYSPFLRSPSLHGGLYRHFSPGMYEEEIRHLCHLSLCLQLTHDAARKSLRGKKEHIAMRKAPLFEGCEIGETNFGVTTFKIGVQAIHFIFP
jgi:hypothetical protein